MVFPILARVSAVLLVGVTLSAPAFGATTACKNTQNFDSWLDAFKKDALAQGISPQILASATPDLTFDPAIIRRDRGQGVFQQPFLQFSDRMLAGYRMQNGQLMMKRHASLFARIEREYGVPPPVLTAFWGLESDFGASFGKYRILRSLVTLAYDCRRADFFRAQLFDALRIVQRGDQKIEDMNGDWAGEFGGMQITASDYFNNAVDFDGDGRRDAIRSIPDTLASAANFLRSLGWEAGQPWIQEVRVPAQLPWDQASLTIQHPVSQWTTWGVRAAHGQLPAADTKASLLLPMGRTGPAFLAYPNFKAFLGWNSAFVYSTTVAYFAARLDGAPLVSRGAADIEVLSPQQMMELQRALVKHGFTVGDIDGKLGAQTRNAVREAQVKVGLPADAWPTAELIVKLGGHAKPAESVAQQSGQPQARAQTSPGRAGSQGARPAQQQPSGFRLPPLFR
ncbi:MAG: lytic murein transglycosylase [Pseudolabrys sp.]|nr:lytic murein transglycosylase [Pseudolabrys sp.]MBV9954119.1 lytic murein transglycosylase [Pseudolabrys sp.]